MARKHHEETVQCGYHYGMPTPGCRLIQLSATPHKASEWQAPQWVCSPCRRRLRGYWRYYPEPERIMPVRMVRTTVFGHPDGKLDFNGTDGSGF